MYRNQSARPAFSKLGIKRNWEQVLFCGQQSYLATFGKYSNFFLEKLSKGFSVLQNVSFSHDVNFLHRSFDTELNILSTREFSKTFFDHLKSFNLN